MTSRDTPRDIVLGTVRRSLGVTGAEAPRRMAVATRLGGHPAGIVPQRGQLPAAERVSLFVRLVEAAAGTAACIPDPAGVPAAVAALLRGLNLPLAIRHGDDARLTALPWDRAGMLRVSRGASTGDDLAAVSHAFAAVAETGTLVLTSGPANPTTLNFLPDVHVVIVRASDVAPDLETVLQRLRDVHGEGAMPRTVNLVTGPSRSADIEQTLILGAHGPRRLHVIVVGEP